MFGGVSRQRFTYTCLEFVVVGVNGVLFQSRGFLEESGGNLHLHQGIQQVGFLLEDLSIIYHPSMELNQWAYSFALVDQDGTYDMAVNHG